MCNREGTKKYYKKSNNEPLINPGDFIPVDPDDHSDFFNGKIVNFFCVPIFITTNYQLDTSVTSEKTKMFLCFICQGILIVFALMLLGKLFKFRTKTKN